MASSRLNKDKRRSMNPVRNIPTWYSRPSGEKIVKCLSNPALDIVVECGNKVKVKVQSHPI
jgi:hypothetical protein